MTRSIRTLLAALAAAFAIAGATTAHAGSVTLSDPNCDSFQLGGVVGAQTLTCIVSSPPVCTVAGPGAGSIGTPVTLTAQCSPAATSWVWTGGNCGIVTTQSCQATSAGAGVVNYTVTGTNGTFGGSPSLPLAVNWSSGPPPAPTGCVASISTVPTVLTTAGGTATVSVSGCSPGSVTYNWSRNGLAGWSTSATPPADTLGTGGTAGYTNSYQVNVCNGATCINVPAVNPLTAFVPGSAGGGGAIDDTACRAAGYTAKLIDIPYPASTTNIRHWSGTSSAGRSWGYTFGNSDMVVVRFVAQGPEATLGALMTVGPQSTDNFKIATLSTLPCDVATSDIPTATQLQVSGGTSANIRMSVDSVKGGYAKLIKGATYYVNIVNRDGTYVAPSCLVSNCGVYIDFN